MAYVKDVWGGGGLHFFRIPLTVLTDIWVVVGYMVTMGVRIKPWGAM